MSMYLISKLQYDSMENRNAYWYENFAYTFDKSVAETYAKEKVHYSESPWPLEFADGKDKNGFVPKYLVQLILSVEEKECQK